MPGHRIFATSFADIYPHYVRKVEAKGRTEAELREVIAWLTGYDSAGLEGVLADGTTVERFYTEAPALNPNAALITGSICGYQVQEIEDPLMRKVRYLDKLVDELAKGKKMGAILRGSAG